MAIPDRLSDIAVFVTVVKQGSFVGAAERLGMSKAQASKCVGRLEAGLGARLLNRTTRRLVLTEAGRTLYENSAPALIALDEAQLAVSTLQGEPRGTLRLAASNAFGVLQMPHILSDLTHRYPELSVEMLLEDRHVDVIGEGVDVAVRITADTPDSALVYRRLGPNRQVVCASPVYLRARALPRQPQDLAQHECIAHLQRATPHVWHFRDAKGGELAVSVRGRLAINSSLAVREAALAGLGVVELNSYLVGEDIKAGRLVHLLPGYRPRELSFYAVFAQRRYLAPKIRVFVDAMVERMTPQPPWDDFLQDSLR